MAGTLEERLSALEAEVTALRDREAIREVIHRYCRAADRCDLDAFKACYWPDGRDDHLFYGGNAWAFCDYVLPLLRKIEASVHAITNTIIELKGDRAFCESQWSVVHRLRKPDPSFLDYWHNGRYLDIFEKRDGEWRILERTIVGDMDRLIRIKDIPAILYQGAGPPEGKSGARFPDDPVYKGFDMATLVVDRPGMEDFWPGYVALAEIL